MAIALADLDPSPIANWRSHFVAPAVDRPALEQVRELQTKAMGFPRQGQTADGRPIPAGVPSVTERWAEIEESPDRKTLRLMTLPHLATDAKLDTLSASEEQVLRDAIDDFASDPPDWEPEAQ